MYGIQVDQDISCRAVGRCTSGARLDREIMDLVPREFDETMSLDAAYAVPMIPLSTNLGRHFLYARYNADLSGDGLRKLGFPNADAASVQKMDAVENIALLLEIGQASAAGVLPEHFGSFL